MTTFSQYTIDGFNCEFTLEMGMTSVMVEKGSFCSSLDFIEHHGAIMNDDTGMTRRVSAPTIRKIKVWADALGY
jgi:hypothetical protein